MRAVASKDQFIKTKMCPHLDSSGGCKRGLTCNYAHKQTELRGMPNLQKTRLCELWLTGSCPNGVECQFAHGEKELRFTPAYFKTDLCKYWKAGFCSAGDECRHAHGVPELRLRKLSSSGDIHASNQQKESESHRHLGINFRPATSSSPHPSAVRAMLPPVNYNVGMPLAANKSAENANLHQLPPRTAYHQRSQISPNGSPPAPMWQTDKKALTFRTSTRPPNVSQRSCIGLEEGQSEGYVPPIHGSRCGSYSPRSKAAGCTAAGKAERPQTTRRNLDANALSGCENVERGSSSLSQRYGTSDGFGRPAGAPTASSTEPLSDDDTIHCDRTGNETTNNRPSNGCFEAITESTLTVSDGLDQEEDDLGLTTHVSSLTDGVEAETETVTTFAYYSTDVSFQSEQSNHYQINQKTQIDCAYGFNELLTTAATTMEDTAAPDTTSPRGLYFIRAGLDSQSSVLKTHNVPGAGCHCQRFDEMLECKRVERNVCKPYLRINCDGDKGIGADASSDERAHVTLLPVAPFWSRFYWACTVSADELARCAPQQYED